MMIILLLQKQGNYLGGVARYDLPKYLSQHLTPRFLNIRSLPKSLLSKWSSNVRIYIY